ncbi:MAG: hypothetical protein AAF366_00215 [Pseudomonadota bacterium]
MVRTVTIGEHISIQGIFVKMLECGKMQVRVGRRVFTGRPIMAA